MRLAGAIALALAAVAHAQAEDRTSKEPLACFTAKVKFIEIVGKREGRAIPVGTQFDMNWLVGLEIKSVEKAAKPLEKKGDEILLIHSPALLFGQPKNKVVGKQFSFKLFGEMKNGAADFQSAEVKEEKNPREKRRSSSRQGQGQIELGSCSDANSARPHNMRAEGPDVLPAKGAALE